MTEPEPIDLASTLCIDNGLLLYEYFDTAEEGR